MEKDVPRFSPIQPETSNTAVSTEDFQKPKTTIVQVELDGELFEVETAEVTAEELWQSMQTDPAWDFLKDEPDIYTLEDGEPV